MTRPATRIPGRGWVVGLAFVAACAAPRQTAPPGDEAATAGAEPPVAPPPSAATTGAAGTLSWEELGVRMVGRETSAGLQIDVTTLDDAALAVAAEDIRAYLRDLKARIPDFGIDPRRAAEMNALLVGFTGFEKEVSFDPTRLIVVSEGSTFYPIHILPISPRFDRRLVDLYETVYGIYLFDESIDLFANLEFRYADLSTGTAWLALVSRIKRAQARTGTGG